LGVLVYWSGLSAGDLSENVVTTAVLRHYCMLQSRKIMPQRIFVATLLAVIGALQVLIGTRKNDNTILKHDAYKR